MHRDLGSPAQTEAMATALAGALRPGDTVLLSGPVGAGKSVIARAAIRALQSAAGQPPEDIPSPSYTLVQEYRAGERTIWHADLYRLGDADEIRELGLDEAMATAIVLIEWPERLPEPPARALTLHLDPDPADPDRRHLTVTATGPAWDAALDATARVPA